MNAQPERLSLSEFVTRVGADDQIELAQEIENLKQTCTELQRHLSGMPELAAQVRRLSDAVGADLVHASSEERSSAATEAGRLTDDIKERWIRADSPPIVDKIDDHLAKIRASIAALTSPGANVLIDAAHRIDALAQEGAKLEGVEQRYKPWALAAMALFCLGLVLFFSPSLVAHIPGLPGLWTVVFCLGALPMVAAHYALKVLPRTRADSEIDTINRAHFLPHGGLYFAKGDRPACVMLVEKPAPPSEAELALAERDKHRERHRRL